MRRKRPEEGGSEGKRIGRGGHGEEEGARRRNRRPRREEGGDRG